MTDPQRRLDVLGDGQADLGPEIWTGCYGEPWRKGHDLVTDSFRHPAKASKSLLMRIVKTGLDRGWWRAGDTVVDPFGGIGTTGIVAAYNGLGVVCVELEPAFVDLCRANFALHRAKWEALDVPQPVVIQGNSRRLRAVLAGADGCVSSPPYAHVSPIGGWQLIEKYVKAGKWHGTSAVGPSTFKASHEQVVTNSPGQVGALREGDFAAAISSPPYAESIHDGNSIDPAKLTGNPTGPHSQAFAQGYGVTAGQVGAMKEGEFQACVTSPPWEKSINDGADHARMRERYPAWGLNPDGSNRMAASVGQDYGKEDGQVGNESGETYWQAVAAIYAEVFALLRPGGHIALIVKDYVHNKQRQPLCHRTWALLQHVGFLPVTRIYAMLGRKWQEEMLTGETVEREKSRKSFFRRLAERKGTPKIDWEEVLVMQKPATARLAKVPDAPLFAGEARP
jgi:hypothetical protein